MNFSAKKSIYALGRLKQGQLNKTESMYSALLNQRLIDGEILWFKFEGIKLRLADNTFLSPDFFVMRSDGELEVHECKGYWTDDARAKTKIAADMYPFRFLIATVKAKRDGGGFLVEELK